MADEMTPEQTLAWKAEQYDHLRESFHELQVRLDAEIQAHKDTREAHAAQIESAVAKATADQQAAHDKHLADVKASVLVPALNDLHARQMADLAEKQKAALDALANA